MVKTLKDQSKLAEDFLTEEEFLRCFETDKVAALFCERIEHQFKKDQKKILEKKIADLINEETPHTTKEEILSLRAHVKHLVSKMEIRPPNMPDKIAIMKKWHKSAEDENELVTRAAL